MKKFTFITAAALMAATALTLASCDKEKENVKPQKAEAATVTVVLNTPKSVNSSMLSKASGVNHGDDEKDKTIVNLQLFVFNADDQIESYANFSGDDLSATNEYTLNVTTGSKTVWAVANSHKVATLAAAKTVSELTAMCMDLSQENVLDFSMVGSADASVTKGAENEVALDLTRFVARVFLGTVKTQMSGAYASTPLTDVQVYLMNAYDEAFIADRKGKTGSIANADTLVRSDFASYQMANMLYEEPGNITAAGNACNKYFYCYGNPGTASKTKLVIRALLDGVEYFYPISITDSQSTSVLSANNAVTIQNVTIKRPGSKRPSDDVSYEDLEFTITVNDWNELDAQNIEF